MTRKDLGNWIDRHSVNCYICGKLFDERESYGTTDDGGDICEDCWKKRKKLFAFFNATLKELAVIYAIDDESAMAKLCDDNSNRVGFDLAEWELFVQEETGYPTYFYLDEMMKGE